jgi:hypothetical protein
MSKFLRVPDGDYKVEVQPGGRITLDTGTDQGQVRVTGDLIVEGDTTTVQSINLTVSDNIIVVNKQDPDALQNGVILDRAGIEVDRGNYVNTFMVFDETIAWAPPGGAVQNGAFTFIDTNDSFIGIRTNSITTGGGDLGLVGSGTGVITVSGTANYEQQVFHYTGPDTIDITAGQDVLGIYATPSIDDPDQDLLEPGIQYAPLPPESGVNLYTTTRGVGGSGILFVHEDETRDEIISNNRALVYSMLF